MADGQSSAAAESLRNLKGFAFDLDGTIWEGPTLLPGAAELVEDLRTRRIGVVFASNCSRHGSNALSHRLAELGILATPTEVLTPFDLVGGEVRRRLGPVPVLVIGTDELAAYSPAPVTRVCQSIAGNRPRRSSSGSTRISTTTGFARPPERSRPELRSSRSTWIRDSRSGPAQFDPGCGALAAGDRGGRRSGAGRDRQAGTDAVPGRHRATGLLRSQSAMVGDSTSSDIEGGRAAGMFTIWLDPEDDEPKPDSADLKVRDLAELHQLWRQAVKPPAARRVPAKRSDRGSSRLRSRSRAGLHRRIAEQDQSSSSASLASSSSPTRAGLALPPVCFMTWPRRKPLTASGFFLPFLSSSSAWGLAAMAAATAAAIASRSETIW